MSELDRLARRVERSNALIRRLLRPTGWLGRLFGIFTSA